METKFLHTGIMSNEDYLHIKAQFQYSFKGAQNYQHLE